MSQEFAEPGNGANMELKSFMSNFNEAFSEENISKVRKIAEKIFKKDSFSAYSFKCFGGNTSICYIESFPKAY